MSNVITLIQEAYASHSIARGAVAQLAPSWVEFVLARLGRVHETAAVLAAARQLAGGGILYGDAAFNRYALERHLGLW